MVRSSREVSTEVERMKKAITATELRMRMHKWADSHSPELQEISERIQQAFLLPLCDKVAELLPSESEGEQSK